MSLRRTQFVKRHRIRIIADGSDEQQAVDALVALVDSGFAE